MPLTVNYRLIPSGKTTSVVLLNANWNKNRLRASTGITAQKKDWDKNKQIFKANALNSLRDNSRLSDIRRLLERKYYAFVGNDPENDNKQEPTIQEMRRMLENAISGLNKDKRAKKSSFLQYFEQFIKESESGKRGTFKTSTTAVYYTVLEHLKGYCEFYRTNLTFEQIDMNFYQKYLHYLRKERDAKDATIGKSVKTLKVFMRYAYEKMKLHNNLQFLNKEFKVFKPKANRIYLNEAEIRKIIEKENLSSAMSKVRDCFLIQIFTGLRVSDLKQLHRENIDLHEMVINCKTVKTGEIVKIPLTKLLNRILEKYDYDISFTHAVQVYNRQIKDLCRICEINDIDFITGKAKHELVSSHSGRISFVTNSLLNGLLPDDIMQITGHRSRAAFEGYIQLKQQESIRRMRESIDGRFE